VAALLSLRASGEASYGDPRTEQVKHISKFHANRARFLLHILLGIYVFMYAF
jgi:hypothetical protein